MTKQQLVERLIRQTIQMTEAERQRFIVCGKVTTDAEMATELAADEEAEFVAELQAEEELGAEWNAPPRATDEDDVELDAAFDEAMEKDD